MNKKEQIIEVLYKFSSELPVKSSVMAEPEIEEWLWSGEFESVATAIDNIYSEQWVKAFDMLQKVDSTLIRDGKIDADTPLHLLISDFVAGEIIKEISPPNQKK